MLLKTYTFLTPFYLFLFPILGILLIYIYLKFSNNKRQIFPSFFLLKNIKEKQKSKKRPFLPFRFFLEILACLLFSIYFSNLEKIGTNEKYLFYIGNSFSTKHKINSYESVFLKIKENALQTLKKLPNNAKIKIITSDNKNSQSFLDKNKAKEKINSLINTYTNEDIKNKIVLDDDYKKTYFFTDKDFKSKDDDLNISSLYNPTHTCNFAISSLGLNLDNLIFEVTSFCMTKKNLNIKILCDEKNVYNKDIPLTYNEDFTDLINVKNFKTPYLPCKILIDAKNDLLQEDNEAFFILNNQNKKNIFLTTTRNIHNKDLIKLPFKIQTINIDNLGSLNKNDIVIFDNINLQSLPKYSSIINLPDKNSIYFKKILEGEEGLSFFDKGNPLITYTNPIEKKFKNAISLNTNASSFSNEIFKIKDDTILSTLENDNNKYVLSGFNILPLKNESTFSKIIFLNSIKYLLKDNFNYLYKNIDENAKENLPGIYLKNGEKQAYNFFSKDESNILSLKANFISIKKVKNKISLESKNKIKDIIIKFLLFILLIEILYMIFKEKVK